MCPLNIHEKMLVSKLAHPFHHLPVTLPDIYSLWPDLSYMLAHCLRH